MAGYKKYLFIDRDGTLIKEPEDCQIDSFEKFALVDQAIPSLLKLQTFGYRLVMVSNQDGLGSVRYPQADFDKIQKLLLQILTSQGINFEDVLICPHNEGDGCFCRKPNVGLVRTYLSEKDLDFNRSAVIGDRESDVLMAQNMGIKGYRLCNDLGWDDMVTTLTAMPRIGRSSRYTKETVVKVAVDLDGSKAVSIRTGLGFFDHMLEQVARHGGFGLKVDVDGDLRVDEHHTVEDTALGLGEAFKMALGDKVGIGRYGFTVPMDEAEARVSIDLSGRPYSVFNGTIMREKIGDLPTELVPHFFRSFAETLGAAIHIEISGDNSHHLIESAFKAVGRSLRLAIARDGSSDIPSTKGEL